VRAGNFLEIHQLCRAVKEDVEDDGLGLGFAMYADLLSAREVGLLALTPLRASNQSLFRVISVDFAMSEDVCSTAHSEHCA
jgi:hypothetical protein